MEVKTKTPGSGKYEYKTFIGEGPKYSMRQVFDEDGKLPEKRNPRAHKWKKVPGPGTYNPKDNTGGPRYTIGVRHYGKNKGSDSTKVPGVGSYNLRKNFEAPSFKIGKEKRENLEMNKCALKNPGPSKYKYNYNGQSSRGPTWSFYRTERFRPKSANVQSINVPGPGQYHHKEFIGKEGPVISFTKDKFQHADAADEAVFKITKNYPSPTTYHPKVNYRPDTPIYSMSKLSRKEMGSDKFALSTPGPSKYNPDKTVSSTIQKLPIWTLSKANRDEDAKVPGSKKKRVQTPGPGNYIIRNGDLPEGPKYSMGLKLQNKSKVATPGPGEYNVVMVHYPCEPKYSMGKEKKEDIQKEAIKNGFPGPEKYLVKDNKFTDGITIPKDIRYKNPKFITPSPGQYKIPTSFDNINEYTRAKGVFDPSFKYV